MWIKPYLDFLNCANNLVIKHDVKDTLTMSNFEHILISISNVAASLKAMKQGKACGIDGLAA